MKKLATILFVIISLNASADIIGAFTKGISRLTSTFSKGVSSKGDFTIKTYLAKDWERSNLDELVIRATSEGGNGTVLVSMNDKLFELSMRSMDVDETLKFAMRRQGNANRMLLDEISKINSLLAHIHTFIRKNDLNPADYSDDIKNVMISLDRTFSGLRINGLTSSQREILENFNLIRTNIVSDLSL